MRRLLNRLLAGCIILLLTATLANAEMVSINRKKVNMRSGPGTSYAILWELGMGYPLKVVRTQKNWLKVQDFEGDEGWIYKPLISRSAHLIVKKKRINVRSGPGQNYKVIGKANYGVVFKTLKRNKGWVKIKHENGLTGWVSRSLVWGW
ncbi:SH3 domain-containing protein [Thermodesulfobacteriota bacterium]